LPKLANLGVTTVELMPVAQFSGARNWGYDDITPDSFWKTAFNLYAQNTLWNRFLKALGMAPSYPGLDVGNPRFGIVLVQPEMEG
jgi:hypothetical protein